MRPTATTATSDASGDDPRTDHETNLERATGASAEQKLERLNETGLVITVAGKGDNENVVKNIGCESVSF